MESHTITLRDTIVHAATLAARLGAGHSEQVYQKALSHELQKANIGHTLEFSVPVIYDGMHLNSERVDLYAKTDDDICVVELKATDSSMRRKNEAIGTGDIVPAAHVQLLKYMRMLSTDTYQTHPTLGMLINFRQRVCVGGHLACELEIDVYNPVGETWETHRV